MRPAPGRRGRGPGPGGARWPAGRPSWRRQAWLAWRDGRRDDVVTLSDELAALMTPATDPLAYHGLVHVWPLAAAHLDAGDVAAAIAAARKLPHYAPPLPAGLEAAIAAAFAAWDAGAPALARGHLTAALTQARALSYL